VVRSSASKKGAGHATVGGKVDDHSKRMKGNRVVLDGVAAERRTSVSLRRKGRSSPV
jgi:hypothetical protein